MRRKFAEWLRKLADRIGPEDSFAATGIRFYFKDRVGMVIEDDGGIIVNPEPPGVRCWYRRSEYHRAHEVS